MYPPELEIKDTTESNTSASYLDLLLSIGRDGQLHTSLYDKRDDFNFHITNFPFLSSNIPSSPAYGVFISQLIRYAGVAPLMTVLSLRKSRKQDLNVLYHFCVFWPIGKTRWPLPLLIGWYILDFSSEFAEGNSTKPYRKQDLNVLFSVLADLLKRWHIVLRCKIRGPLGLLLVYWVCEVDVATFLY